MPREAFLLLFAVAAFVLAVWVDVRFPALVPSTTWRLAGHVIAGALICTVALGPVSAPLAAAGSLGRMVAVLAVALPALSYAMLGGVWVFKMMRGAMGSQIR